MESVTEEKAGTESSSVAVPTSKTSSSFVATTPTSMSPSATTSSLSGSLEARSRGWPKGRKRYPKLPGAPKQPLSGYVHFLNDQRQLLKEQQPHLSFAQTSRKLADDWANLAESLKKEYVEKAERDKERYNREFKDFMNTKEYADYLNNVVKQEAKEEKAGNGNKKENKAKKENSNSNAKKDVNKGKKENSSSAKKDLAKKESKDVAKKESKDVAKKETKDVANKESTTKKSKQKRSTATADDHDESEETLKVKKSRVKLTNDDGMNDCGESSKSVDELEVPIFTEAFLAFNRGREQELKQLKRHVSEMEERNATLQRHIDDLKTTIETIEKDEEDEEDKLVQRQLTNMRRTFVKALNGIDFSDCWPGHQTITHANIDAFTEELHNIVVTRRKKNDALLDRVKAVLTCTNFDDLDAIKNETKE